MEVFIVQLYNNISKKSMKILKIYKYFVDKPLILLALTDMKHALQLTISLQKFSAAIQFVLPRDWIFLMLLQGAFLLPTKEHRCSLQTIVLLHLRRVTSRKTNLRTCLCLEEQALFPISWLARLLKRWSEHVDIDAIVSEGDEEQTENTDE